MVQLFKPAHGRYTPRDKDSFSYTTVTHRWPVIITNIVSTVSSENHKLANDDPRLAEGKAIISELSALKHQMGRNSVLQPIQDDGGGNLACYNDELAATPEEEKRWFTANWLFAECYLYRVLRSLFARTQHWADYDPFFESKAETYKSSSTAIVHLAEALNAMVTDERLQDGWEKEGSRLEIAFWEMIQAALWGNATDLSLLVDLKYEDLQKLQAVGKAAQAAQAAKVLRDDLPKVWALLKTVKDGQVDIVLDNAGFELYTDLVFADFLISCTPFVNKVVFHPKTVPWFVSDVLPYDFGWAIDSLLDTSFFASHAQLKDGDTDSLTTLAQRWKAHVAEGRFHLSVPVDTKMGADVPAANFWCTQFAYQDLPAVDPELLAALQKSDLVVFKGDLNYRKLIGDAKWPTTTPFEEAIGPLNGKINLVSLRTNKADTICGLPEGTEERLDAEDKTWRISGKYAIVSFAARA